MENFFSTRFGSKSKHFRIPPTRSLVAKPGWHESSSKNARYCGCWIKCTTKILLTWTGRRESFFTFLRQQERLSTGSSNGNIARFLFSRSIPMGFAPHPPTDWRDSLEQRRRWLQVVRGHMVDGIRKFPPQDVRLTALPLACRIATLLRLPRDARGPWQRPCRS